MGDLKTLFNEDVRLEVSKDGRPIISVKPERFLELILHLKTKRDFNQLISIAGVDYPKENAFVCVYHLTSACSKALVEVKASVRREGGTVPSLTNIFKNADWFEREIHEMFGLGFDGNRNLGRLLLPEDWQGGYPLRKDFKLVVSR